MSNDTDTTFDHRHYPIEKFGLSVEECESIFEQMNGIMPNMKDPLPVNYLEMGLLAGAAASADDHAKYGWDTSLPRRDSSQAPALLANLARKVSELPSWRRDAIAYYALGFWGGINTAAREREELAASGAVLQA